MTPRLCEAPSCPGPDEEAQPAPPPAAAPEVQPIAEAPLAVPVAEAPIAPPLTAKIGFELEIGTARVLPFVPKGTILATADGWNLETDKIPNKEFADLEFVLAPTWQLADVQRAMSEILSLVAVLRDAALKSPRRRVGLRELALDGMPWKLAPGLDEHVIHVGNIHFRTRLQASFGIALERFPEYLDLYLPPVEAVAIHRATHDIAHHVRCRLGTELSPRARGFVELLNYMLRRASVRRQKVAGPKMYFCVMMRSDFCAAFHRLLDGPDRGAIGWLLAPGPDGRPAFMAALGLRAGTRVFRHPYFDARFDSEPGPLLEDWLVSIVHGRGEGCYRKDLLSPPPGYAIHTEKIDACHGAGAMGVDEENGRALFEIRAAPYRWDMPANRTVLAHSALEFQYAQRFNPALEGDAKAAYAPHRGRLVRVRRHQAFLETCMRLQRDLALLEQARTQPAEPWREAQADPPAQPVQQAQADPPAQPARDAARTQVAAALDACALLVAQADAPAGSAWVAVDAIEADIERWLRELHAVPAQLLGPLGPDEAERLDQLERALWDAGNEA